MNATEFEIIEKSFKKTAGIFQAESDAAALANDYPRAIERLTMKQGAETARFDLMVAFSAAGVRAQ